MKCRAKTKEKARCKNDARPKHLYCSRHKNYLRDWIKNNIKKFILWLAGGIVMIFIGIFIENQTNNKFDTTIQIVDWNGIADKTIYENGSVNILNEAGLMANINGEIKIHNIPAIYKDSMVKIEFVPNDNYPALKYSASIKLKAPPEKSEFKIKVKGLDKIYGYVKDTKNQIVIGAKVTIQGVQELSTITDSKGWYSITEIAPKYQKWEQTIQANKDNLEGSVTKNLMGNTKNIDIIIEEQ
ncbi:MAG: carboxypeptidase-like regulatory domain-containing protein [Prevotellaceae bacterium]|jgi:hypothetical protein|nr:carboxypeptidase-like regulatory domain-containing protein [Prevotellaceae bacterium]